MRKNSRQVRIGFDLDGVIIGKPPVIPKTLLEWLYRGKTKNGLTYRFPGRPEQFIRWLSHHPLLRPPIEKNVKKLSGLSKDKKYEVYAISSRYSFLEKRTREWLDYYKLNGLFDEVYLNLKNEQPHLFKEKKLKELKLDYFIDDDLLLVEYLEKKVRARVLTLSDVGKVVNEFEIQEKPRVLVGISYYQPNISGLTIYAKNISEELVERGYQIKILTSRHLKKLPSQEMKNGLLIKRLWTPFILGRGPIMPTYLPESLRAVWRSDLVNIHIPQFEGFVLAAWAKILGKRVILTHHCDLSDWPGLVNKITEKATYLSLMITGLLADKIIVYTKDYADNSSYLSRFRQKLVYILPPVKIKNSKGKKKIKCVKAKYKIGFAGRIAREKGIDVLFKAIPLIEKKVGSNFKIFLVGPSSEVVGGGDKKIYADLVKKHADNIEFLGPLKQEQMPSFYSMLDVLVLPSTEKLESFGLVQVEAMLLGCPVVASNLPGVRMPIKLSGMGRTAKPGDARSLAESISKVILQRSRYIAAKKKVRKIFNNQETINKYEELFAGMS